MNKNLLILPTINEEKNVKLLLKQILKTKIQLDILVIDDGSSDNTLSVINNFKKKNRKSKIFVKSRKKRLGIGKAHKDGLLYAYRKKYNYAITMDSDLAHHPKYIFNLLSHNKKNDLVLGSRYLKKNSAINYNFLRTFLSNSAFLMTRLLFNHNFDSTNSFRCYNLRTIKKDFIIFCKTDHYDFFFTSLAYLNKKKYSIFQFPMKIYSRNYGNTKMTLPLALRSVKMILVVFFKILLLKN